MTGYRCHHSTSFSSSQSTMCSYRISTAAILMASLSLLCILIKIINATTEVSTVPDPYGGNIDLEEGQENFLIICNASNNGEKIITEWFILREKIDLSLQHIGISPVTGKIVTPIDLADKVIISGQQILSAITFGNRFLIKNFTRSFHTTKLQCGSETVRKTFNLGIKVAPIVQNYSVAVFIEGDFKSIISLNVTAADAGLSIWPPINFFNWTYEGEEVLNDNSTLVEENSITFTNISRHRAGIYILSVSNGMPANHFSGNFLLEIHYPPSATPFHQKNGTAIISVEVNGSATLIAFYAFSIKGFPNPNIVWTRLPGGENVSSSDRHFTETPGQLTIHNVKTSDAGRYKCGIYNFLSTELFEHVDLQVVEPQIAANSSTLAGYTYFNSRPSPEASSVMRTFIITSLIVESIAVTPATNNKNAIILSAETFVGALVGATIVGALLVLSIIGGTVLVVIAFKNKCTRTGKQIEDKLSFEGSNHFIPPAVCEKNTAYASVQRHGSNRNIVTGSTDSYAAIEVKPNRAYDSPLDIIQRNAARID